MCDPQYVVEVAVRRHDQIWRPSHSACPSARHPPVPVPVPTLHLHITPIDGKIQERPYIPPARALAGIIGIILRIHDLRPAARVREDDDGRSKWRGDADDLGVDVGVFAVGVVFADEVVLYCGASDGGTVIVVGVVEIADGEGARRRDGGKGHGGMVMVMVMATVVRRRMITRPL